MDNFSLRRKRKPAKIKTQKLADGSKITTIKTAPEKRKKRNLFKRIEGGLAPLSLKFRKKHSSKGSKGSKGSTKKTVGAAATEYLKPLMPAMKIGLKQKGFSVSAMSEPQVIEKFYNEYISKKADIHSTYEPLKENEFANHYLFSTDYDSFDSNNLVGISDLQTLATVGKGIVNGFKKWRTKRKAAKAAKKNPELVMPKEEVILAKEADKTVEKLEKEVKSEEPVKGGDMKKYLIFGAVGIAGLLLFLKFRK